MNGRAEALCFNREIHQADRAACGGGAVSNSLHTARLNVAVRDQLLYGDAEQLDGREGQYGDGLLNGGFEQIAGPLIHVHFHNILPPVNFVSFVLVILKYHVCRKTVRTKVQDFGHN